MTIQPNKTQAALGVEGPKAVATMNSVQNEQSNYTPAGWEVNK